MRLREALEAGVRQFFILRDTNFSDNSESNKSDIKIAAAATTAAATAAAAALFKVSHHPRWRNRHLAHQLCQVDRTQEPVTKPGRWKSYRASKVVSKHGCSG